MARKNETRYTLSLPEDVYDELVRLKEKRNTSLKAVIHQVLKVGLYAMKVADTPDATLLVRENNELRELVFL